MIKYSVGDWASGPAIMRFVPPAYHQEVAKRRKEANEARASRGET